MSPRDRALRHAARSRNDTWQAAPQIQHAAAPPTQVGKRVASQHSGALPKWRATRTFGTRLYQALALVSTATSVHAPVGESSLPIDPELQQSNKEHCVQYITQLKERFRLGEEGRPKFLLCHMDNGIFHPVLQQQLRDLATGVLRVRLGAAVCRHSGRHTSRPICAMDATSANVKRRLHGRAQGKYLNT